MPASLGVRSLNVGAPVNPLAPLNRGLQGWWQVLPQRPGGVTWHTLAPGVGADATLIGLSPPSATGGWNATRRVGGWGEVRTTTGGYGRVPQCVWLDAIPAFTFSVWARQTTLDVIGGLFHKYVTGATQTGLYTYNDGFLYFEISNATIGYVFVDYSTVISAGAWFHLAAVFNGALTGNTNRAKLYLNGTLLSVSNGGTVPALTSNHDAVAGSVVPLTLGRYMAGTPTSWVGALDDLRVWNRALEADEVRTLYLTSRQGSPQELTWQTWPPGWAGPAAAAVPGTAPPPRRQPWRIFWRAA
jgi:Concanavalin A-like lectin/glucanases superfamily